MTTNLTNFGSATGALSLVCNAPTLTVKGNTQAQTIAACGYARSLTFTYGTSTGTLGTTYKVDTMANFVRQIAVSPGTDTLTLSALAGTSTSSPTVAAMKDVLNQPTPVFARIAGILLELLTTGDTVGPSDPTPTLAASVNIGNAVANKWTALINTTGTIPLANANSVAWVSRTAGGFAVASGSNDQLLLTNTDSIVAVYRGVIFGAGT